MTAAHQPWHSSAWFATWLRLARNAALLLACVWSVSGASYYVATSGSDSADGSIATPWLTVAHGISQLSGQDTLYLRGGTYTNDWNLGGIPSGASWSTMTTIRNYASETPVIKPQTTNDVFGFNLTSGQYVCIQGVTINLTNTMSTGAGVKITENANHIRLTNCVITAIASGHGILLTGGTADNADDNEILNCTVSYAGWLWDGGSGDQGIYVKNRRNKIIGCTVYSNQDHGIQVFDGNPEQLTIANCRFYSNQTGLGLYSAGAISNVVYNCLSYSNNIAFMAAYNAATNQFLNCTAWDNSEGFDVKEDAGPGMVYENCIAFRNSTADRSGSFRNLSAYPFTVRNCIGASNVVNTIYDAAGGSTLTSNLIGDGYGVNLVDWTRGTTNFYLKTGSVAVDAGRTQSLFSADVNGVSRPQLTAWDIGAYEYVATIKTRGFLRKR